jgi:hypothetical protein
MLIDAHILNPEAINKYLLAVLAQDVQACLADGGNVEFTRSLIQLFIDDLSVCEDL